MLFRSVSQSRYQLINQRNQTITLLHQLLQRTAPLLKLLDTQTQNNTHLKHHQRRTQLINHIDNELQLTLKQTTQTLVELIQHFHQQQHFARQPLIQQQLQIIANPLNHFPTQHLQQAQNQVHHQPHRQ